MLSSFSQLILSLILDTHFVSHFSQFSLSCVEHSLRVVPKEMTAAARRRIFEPTDEERAKGGGSLGCIHSREPICQPSPSFHPRLSADFMT